MKNLCGIPEGVVRQAELGEVGHHGFLFVNLWMLHDVGDNHLLYSALRTGMPA